MITEKEYVEQLFQTMKSFNVLCMKEDVNSFTVCIKYNLKVLTSPNWFLQVFQKGLISLQANVETRVEKRNEIMQLFELAIQEDVKLLSKDIAAVQIAANVKYQSAL